MAEFFRPFDKIAKHGSRLPHWEQDEAMQFVTFRLGDAMPVGKLRRWKEDRATWLDLHPKPWSPEKEKEYHQRFTRMLEGWLDDGMGSCLFRDGDQRKVLEEVLMRFQGERVEHHAWVIMPNHLHLLFTPKDSLETLMKAWKGPSAGMIGLGSIWQANYRDTLIRDGEHFANAVRYIRKNPVKLPPENFTLWEGPRALAIR